MLGNYPIGATIPVSDQERAKQWYGEKLGLTPVNQTPDGNYIYESGDTMFVLYTTPGAGEAQHTLAGWLVDDLDAVMADMRGRGVVFEEYDMPGLQTVDGVATMGDSRGAWFKDGDGNILSVFQM